MNISQHTRFENHIEVVLPENHGDAEKKSDYFDENPYDDDFEAKLSGVNSITPKKYENYDINKVDEYKRKSDLTVEFEKNSNGEVKYNEAMPSQPTHSASKLVDDKEEKLYTSSNGGNTTEMVSTGQSRSIYQISEKIISFASAMDMVGDFLSGGSVAHARPNKIERSDLFDETSVVSCEENNANQSINQIIGNLGYEIDSLKDEIVENYIVDVGQTIESIGSDEENRAEFITDQAVQNPDLLDNKSTEHLESSYNPPASSNSLINRNTLDTFSSQNIVFQSVVNANSDYGDGGGTQYFIPKALELKKSGQLKQLGDSEILNFNEKEVFKSDVRDSENSDYKIHFDKRNMTEEEISQLLESTGKISNEELFDVPNYIGGEELDYLDENTIATDGITDINDEILVDETGKKKYHEDYIKPLGNQEDSDGNVMPDSWMNPEELEEGKIYYQLSPMYSDAYQDTKSSYFTDEETVNACRDKNGSISLSTLMQKLQIEAKIESVKNKKDNETEVFVRNYILTPYVYTKKNLN